MAVSDQPLLAGPRMPGPPPSPPHPQQRQLAEEEIRDHLTPSSTLLDVADLALDDAPATQPTAPKPRATSQDDRPEAERRSTEPAPSSSSSSSSSSATLLSAQMHERPRNRSPYGYTRAHLRSQSHASALAPAMARTRSLPSVASSGSLSGNNYRDSLSPARPSSPNTRASGRQSPRRSLEEGTPAVTAPSFMDIAIIAEDSELDLSAQHTPNVALPTLRSMSFSRSNSGRRRPSSPLHSQLAASQSTTPQVTVSPSLSNGKFNEPFPAQPRTLTSSASLNTLYSSSSSTSGHGARDSMPSTPTSLRSRSPSVSSLETIPDSPDAEEEAVEEYNLAQLKAAADAADAQAEAERTGSSTTDRGKSKSRKRWSVCGAERRTDFEMETIWED